MAWRKTRRKSNRQCANYLDDDELADLPDSPDAALFASLLRRCKKLPQARRLHSYIALSGLETISRVVANMIVHMYGACGSVDDSWTMFQRMRSPRNVYSWNILVTANANNGHLADAGAVLSRMPQHDKASWTLHIAMLARSGKLALAQRVFDDIIDPDVTAWNAIIAVYAETGHSKEALALFRKLDIEGVASDSITFISVLDSCNDLRLGKIIHAEAANSGFLDSTINLGTAVVTMYARCQSLRDAEQSFSQMPHRNVVSWSAMTAAYARSNSVDRAEQAFQRTPSHCSISANTMIWSYVQSSRLRDAKNIFDSMADRDVVSWSSMLCGYTSGIDYDIHNAREFFQSMPASYASVSAWNTLLAAYARSGHYTETVLLFKIMDLEGFQPDELTFSSAFEACRGVSGAKTGRILPQRGGFL